MLNTTNKMHMALLAIHCMKYSWLLVVFFFNYVVVEAIDKTDYAYTCIGEYLISLLS